MATGFQVMLVLLAAVSFGSTRPEASDVNESPLKPCPNSPNCVSSEASESGQRVSPFRLKSSSPDAWQALRDLVAATPRTVVVTITDTYLHAESRSRFWKFVDDLELSLNPSDGWIQVRSASRVGYSDLGVNRRRVEALREDLRSAGLIE